MPALSPPATAHHPTTGADNGARARPSSSRLPRSLPFSHTWPRLGKSNPASSPSSVDLPAPDGPTIANDSPATTDKLTSARIVNSPSGTYTCLPSPSARKIVVMRLPSITILLPASGIFPGVILGIALSIALIPMPTTAQTTNTILVLGDSLSAVYGLSAGQGWVELLQQRLHSLGNNATLVNASVSGTTSSSTLSRLDKLLQQHKPGICIIELGANDGLRGQPLQQREDTLRAILDGCRHQQAQTLLLGMRLPPNYGHRYTEGFADIYQRLTDNSADTGIPFFLDGIAQQDNLMQADRLHPTAAAQPLLMETVWQHPQPLLHQTSRQPARTRIATP